MEAKNVGSDLQNDSSTVDAIIKAHVHHEAQFDQRN